jgi:hypothetical protein
MIVGFVLVFIAKKQVKDRNLRKFLILTGLSAGLFLILAILHNVFYGIAESFADNAIIKGIMSVLEVVSFMGAICVVPIVFIIGVVGSIIVYKRKKK